jgi:hypothetical protein
MNRHWKAGKLQSFAVPWVPTRVLSVQMQEGVQCEKLDTRSRVNSVALFGQCVALSGEMRGVQGGRPPAFWRNVPGRTDHTLCVSVVTPDYPGPTHLDLVHP